MIPVRGRAKVGKKIGKTHVWEKNIARAKRLRKKSKRHVAEEKNSKVRVTQEKKKRSSSERFIRNGPCLGEKDKKRQGAEKKQSER